MPSFLIGVFDTIDIKTQNSTYKIVKQDSNNYSLFKLVDGVYELVLPNIDSSAKIFKDSVVVLKNDDRIIRLSSIENAKATKDSGVFELI